MQVNNSGNTSGGGHDEAYHSERNTLLNEVESLKHDLRLVVCYPVIGANYAKHEDLYKAIVNNPQNQLHSDTDVIVDMENQINANSARIGVLTTQNQSFQNSLGKLEQANIDVRNKEMVRIYFYTCFGRPLLCLCHQNSNFLILSCLVFAAFFSIYERSNWYSSKTTVLCLLKFAKI